MHPYPKDGVMIGPKQLRREKIMIVPDVDYRNAAEAIDQAMDSIRNLLEEEGGYRNQIRIAEDRDTAWAVVEDESGEVEDLTLLYHSENPAEIVAYLLGWLRGKRWRVIKNEENDEDEEG